MRAVLWLCPEATHADPAAVRGRYAWLSENTLAAVASGFAGIAASEHHWRDDGYCPDALGLLTGLGALARPPVLMSAIIPLPFWDARILGERAAVAAAVSGAEVWLGVGTGCDPHELEVAGWTDAELWARTTASLEQLCRFAVRGLAGIHGPPRLLLGAMTSAGVRRAAQAGLGWIGDPRATLPELAALGRAYRAEGGIGPVVAMRDGYVGEDSAAWLHAVQQDHARFWATPRRGLRGRASPGAEAIARDVLVHGAAAAVAATLARLREAIDPDLLCVRIELPTWQDRQQTLRQLERWRPLLAEPPR